MFKINVFAAVGGNTSKDNSHHGYLCAAPVGGISSLRFGQDVSLVYHSGFALPPQPCL
jgi:hypothetical protein